MYFVDVWCVNEQERERERVVRPKVVSWKLVCNKRNFFGSQEQKRSHFVHALSHAICMCLALHIYTQTRKCTMRSCSEYGVQECEYERFVYHAIFTHTQRKRSHTTFERACSHQHKTG